MFGLCSDLRREAAVWGAFFIFPSLRLRHALRPPVRLPVTRLLLPLYGLVVDVLFIHPENYSGELRVQIVSALLAVIAMVGAYWLHQLQQPTEN